MRRMLMVVSASVCTASLAFAAAASADAGFHCPVRAYTTGFEAPEFTPRAVNGQGDQGGRNIGLSSRVSALPDSSRPCVRSGRDWLTLPFR